MSRTINYNFYHWGPFLYHTTLDKTELNKIKKVCSKKSKDYRKNLAGLIRHEHEVDVKKLFPIIAPYVESYAQGYASYRSEPIGKNIELISAWVNYMIKGESNPLHTHDEDLSFVIFTKVPKNLREECFKTKGNGKPGMINFVIALRNDDSFLEEHSFFPEEGSFYIFPASLHHYVNGFQCEGERISVSGNLQITKFPKKKIV